MHLAGYPAAKQSSDRSCEPCLCSGSYTDHAGSRATPVRHYRQRAVQKGSLRMGELAPTRRQHRWQFTLIASCLMCFLVCRANPVVATSEQARRPVEVKHAIALVRGNCYLCTFLIHYSQTARWVLRWATSRVAMRCLFVIYPGGFGHSHKHWCKQLSTHTGKTVVAVAFL